MASGSTMCPCPCMMMRSPFGTAASSASPDASKNGSPTCGDQHGLRDRREAGHRRWAEELGVVGEGVCESLQAFPER